MASQKDYALNSLKEIANWDGKAQEIPRVVAAAFGADDYVECIRNLQEKGIDSGSYINSLDKVRSTKPVLTRVKKICGNHEILPDSHMITHSLRKTGPRPFTCGGSSGVQKFTDERNATFAVKSIPVYDKDPVERINKKYYKEVIVCKRMMHDNILTIEGVARDLFEFCLVSQWMVNGDILTFVTKHPEVDRLDLLIGITRGLDYLHRNDIIHGGLKSPNILIEVESVPRLSDFGLCSMNSQSFNASNTNHRHTIRYNAPELLDNDEPEIWEG